MLLGQQITVRLLPTSRVARMAESVLPAPVPDQLPTRFLVLTRVATNRCIRSGGVNSPSTLLISAEVAKPPGRIGSWTTNFQNRLVIGAKAGDSGLGNSKNKDGTNKR